MLAVPVRLAGLVIVIQLAWLADVHEHPELVVTMTCDAPPAVGKVAAVGFTVNVHVPSCVTVTL
jgi:hypothetical protein